MGWPLVGMGPLVGMVVGGSMHPSYCLIVTFPLSLDVGYLFLVGSNILLSTAVQKVVAILVVLQEMNVYPSTLPS